MSRIALGALGALSLLVWLSLTPDIPHAELVAKYAGPPSEFITLPSGARVHYRVSGPADGKVLLLVHGSGASLHTWEPWRKLLDGTLRVVALDMPGHGLTGAVPGDRYTPDGVVPFVEEFRRALGLERFVIAGNSRGGNVAWRYALATPMP